MKKATNPIFGLGRRLCPGMQGTLFAIITTTLATCDPFFSLLCFITDVVSVFRFPEPFTMRLKSRSAQAAALLANPATLIARNQAAHRRRWFSGSCKSRDWSLGASGAKRLFELATCRGQNLTVYDSRSEWLHCLPLKDS